MKYLFGAISILWFGLTPTLTESSSNTAPSTPTHGFSTYGKLKYPETFTHFDYTNPYAPKGGKLRLGTLGTFDSLNPFIIKGVPPRLIYYTTATLLEGAEDRSGESYAYAAESVELAPDRTWVIFRLNPKAKFNNGDPVTADDVIWAFETLRTKGIPMYRTYYKNISKAEKLDNRSIKFHFDNAADRELPLILGQIPILSKKFYETHKFEETSLVPPPSSGPYEIAKVKPGHQFVIRRVKNWWGASIPSQKGRHNFDKLKSDYYLESNALFEGFKSGQYDIHQETVAKNWAKAYTFPAFVNGYVKREELKHALSTGTVGLIFNTRRPPFSDIRVRKAMTLLLDFPWINDHIFYGLYTRNESYFPNSDFEAMGPPTEKERAILQPFQDKLPSEVLNQSFHLPAPQTEGDHRKLQEEALNLLKDAGYVLKDTIMVNAKTGKPLVFEVLIYDKALEKIFLNFSLSVQRLGIKLRLRNLDTAAYELRVDNLDFDMIYAGITQSNSLGNEQRDYFGSEKADIPGTRNYAGIKNPVVDKLIEDLIVSPSYKSMVAHAKALDRVLLWNYYMIPAWNHNTIWVAYWNRFSRPSITPKYRALDISTWWFDKRKNFKLTNDIENKPDATKPSSSWTKRLWEKTHTWIKGLIK